MVNSIAIHENSGSTGKSTIFTQQQEGTKGSSSSNTAEYKQIEKRENQKELDNKKSINQLTEKIKHYNIQLLSCLEFYKDITGEDFNKEVVININQTKENCKNCIEHISEKKELTNKYTNRINSLNEKIDTLENQISTLEDEVYLDELTQINNRKRFFQYYNAAINSAENNPKKTFTLAIIDVDRFKHFNDTYGHPAGDTVLKLITALITQQIHELRKSTALCRIGGEEFAIISRKPLHDIQAIVEQVLKTLSTKIISIPGIPKDYRLSFSVGVASYGPHMNGKHMALIEAADKRLYRAKNNGRAQICSSD